MKTNYLKKICSECKELKVFSAFSKGNDSNNLQYRCKECEKLYRFNNRKKIAIRKKQYRKNHMVAIKQWRIDNKEQIKIQRRQYSQKYYQNNRDIVLDKSKQYYEKNKVIMSKKTRLYYKNNKELFSARQEEYIKKPAKYLTFYNKLTIDEAPLLASDGVSLRVKCKYCNKYFIPTNNEAARRIASLGGHAAGDNYLYCSNGCKSSCPIYRQHKYPKGFKKASSREVNSLIRQICFERDGWTCQICGATQKDAALHCHHIEGVAQNPRLSNDIKNTVTLCKACHKEVHKLPGCNYYELQCNTKEK